MSESDDADWTPTEQRLAVAMLPYLVESGWIASRRSRQSVDRGGNPIPWITYPALDFMTPRVGAGMTVFEFGSGNSTLWWSQRVAHVMAVEHDAVWASKVAETLPSNASVSHVPLESGGDYCHHAQASGRRFDVIVVDGRDRVNCALSSIECLNPDGVIIWDNTERSRYAAGLRALSKHGFRRIGFRGPSPINTFASETSVLYRRSNCFDI